MEQCHLRHNLTLFHNKVLEEYILSPPGIKKVQLHLGCMSPKDFSVLPYNNCTTNVPYRRQRALKAIFTCTNRKFWCQHISVSIEFTALVLDDVTQILVFSLPNGVRGEASDQSLFISSLFKHHTAHDNLNRP